MRYSEAIMADNQTPEAGSAGKSGWDVPLALLCQQLDASERGLTGQEARRRRQNFGANEPAPANGPGVAMQLWWLFADPLAVILLLASIVSAFVGELASAVVIMVMVLLGIGLDFIQTYRSQRAVQRLRESVASTATVLRDGQWAEAPRGELVPGDIIRLSAGDQVPADARLLEARDLHVQQAALTGESMPVEKEAGKLPAALANLADVPNAVFFGTSVVSGSATALVVHTGARTAFGDIAARLASKPPETEFDRGTRRFGFFIVQTVFFLVLVVFLFNLAVHRSPLQSLLFAVALAVGLTPGFLPMIIAVTLSSGAVHLARRKVIVKHLAAMQNLGSMDILCSDKTGTLTSGVMTLDKSLDVDGEASDKVFRLAYLNSYHETGIKSALDAAILKHTQLEITASSKVDEIPFDFERRRLSVVVAEGAERRMITKGAPESVLHVCTTFEAGGEYRDLTEAARSHCVETYCKLSADGYRVLAVASRPVAVQDGYHAVDEREMALVGFLTFVDPPLEGAAEVLRTLHRDGVVVKILTGDNELVTRHVCATIGLDGTRIVLGEQIERMSDAALGHVAEETTVFARISPAQKNRVILALKHRGHVVGYLGDGINDAPSLHAADVGISVANAVDVAKDAAEIILQERSLRVLHTGILEGRKAFGNVMKYLLMGTSSNFGNMFSMAVASLFLPFLPMLPVQILLNTFLYDLAQVTIPTDHVDPSFMRKPRRWDISLIRKFMIVIGPISSLYDLLTFYILLEFFQASEAFFQTGWFVESLVTQTLVLLVIRTAKNPLHSRPSLPLLASVVAIVVVGMALPFTPVAGVLGFVPLPAPFFLFLLVATGTYLILVEWTKRWLLGRAGV